MPTFHSFLYFTLLCLSFVLADYTIDDSNYTTLKFSGNPAGPVWGPFGSDTNNLLGLPLSNGTELTLEATPCYDGTYTYAACRTSDNCTVQFTFIGSGITIYVLRAGPQGMSASLSIDSGTVMTSTLDAPPAPQHYIPQVVLFDVQNIASGTHTAIMTVLDWNGGFSGMMLDYIDVNQAEVLASTTSSSSSSIPTLQSSSTSSPTSQVTSTTAQTSSVATATTSGNGTANTTSNKTNVAAAVGAGVGCGVRLLALIGLITLYFRHRDGRNKGPQNESPGPLSPQQNTTTNTRSINPSGSFASLSVSQARTMGAMCTTRSWSNLGVGSTLYFTAQEQHDSSPNLAYAPSASSGDDGVTSIAPGSTLMLRSFPAAGSSVGSPASEPPQFSPSHRVADVEPLAVALNFNGHDQPELYHNWSAVV